MRSTDRAKQKKFRWYQKKIFIPGVKANRAEFDEDSGGPQAHDEVEIPIRDTAVVSVDGDIPQLKAVIEELGMYEDQFK